MAFDITPYIHKSPAEVRALIREGKIDFPTSGMCAGYAQANLVILPPDYAADFEEYTRLNPFPCPVLEIVKGSPVTHDMGEGANICTDIPRYRIYENGIFTKEVTDASAWWKDGYVGYNGVMGNFHIDIYKWMFDHFRDQPVLAQQVQDWLTMAAVTEARAYPVNAKFHCQLTGLPMTLVTRAKDPSILNENARHEIESLINLEREERQRLGLKL